MLLDAPLPFCYPSLVSQRFSLRVKTPSQDAKVVNAIDTGRPVSAPFVGLVRDFDNPFWDFSPLSSVVFAV